MELPIFNKPVKEVEERLNHIVKNYDFNRMLPRILFNKEIVNYFSSEKFFLDSLGSGRYEKVICFDLENFKSNSMFLVQKKGPVLGKISMIGSENEQGQYKATKVNIHLLQREEIEHFGKIRLRLLFP
jgi:hypothetical protein